MYLIDGDHAVRCAIHALDDEAARPFIAIDPTAPWQIADVVTTGVARVVERLDLALPGGGSRIPRLLARGAQQLFHHSTQLREIDRLHHVRREARRCGLRAILRLAIARDGDQFRRC